MREYLNPLYTYEERLIALFNATSENHWVSDHCVYIVLPPNADDLGVSEKMFQDLAVHMKIQYPEKFVFFKHRRDQSIPRNIGPSPGWNPAYISYEYHMKSIYSYESGF